MEENTLSGGIGAYCVPVGPKIFFGPSPPGGPGAAKIGGHTPGWETPRGGSQRHHTERILFFYRGGGVEKSVQRKKGIHLHREPVSKKLPARYTKQENTQR